jgi:site-specific recombinase XerD
MSNLVLIYDSAIRLAELLDLRIGNVYLEGENSHIRVFRKGSKERVVSISQTEAYHINRYIDSYLKKKYGY